MPPKSKKNAQSSSEVQVQKSPAEFFAEHQAIAGFDNAGKSLYTSLRELVENALDACESIGALPEVSVHITEYTQQEFNQQQLSSSSSPPLRNAVDTELFQKKSSSTSNTSSALKPAVSSATAAAITATPTAAASSTAKATAPTASKTEKKKKTASQQEAYFAITVKDNGCGMRHKDIPELLGRVLSGSKYGVRQTRGKFGLGAKMALIWSRKSTGQPIEIITAHRTHKDDRPDKLSTCVLDIDIYKNEPKVLKHKEQDNTEAWVGTQLQLLIAGNWTTYKSRIVQYFSQLAIITPYAILHLTYKNAQDSKRNLELHFDRRSEQMPPPAKTVKHHPSSVNNIVLQQLIRQSPGDMTLVKFLSTQLACVSPPIAKRLVNELQLQEELDPTTLTSKQVTRMVQLLRQVQLFKAPDGSCLSPLGEYNLNLGIQQVLQPDLIATARDRVGAYEGHSFLVEAAVSLGCNNKNKMTMHPGLTVYRFANRIPLLFEGGADVATRVALTKIKWSNYKIDYKNQKVGVFVSIVSTKIPFKGTSKEYIGDDATEIQQSVKRALQSCCQQLRAHLMKRNALNDAKQRKSRLAKYIPDVSRALFGLLDGMRKRKHKHDDDNESSSDNNENDDTDDEGSGGSSNSRTASTTHSKKRLRLESAAVNEMIARLNKRQVTEESIQEHLRLAIEEENPIENAGEVAAKKAQHAKPLYLIPLYNMEDAHHDIVVHPLFVFRPIQPPIPHSR